MAAAPADAPARPWSPFVRGVAALGAGYAVGIGVLLVLGLALPRSFDAAILGWLLAGPLQLPLASAFAAWVAVRLAAPDRRAVQVPVIYCLALPLVLGSCSVVWLAIDAIR